MNITVAVGLITAGSTLAGGLIASITGLKIQGKQLREKNVLLKLNDRSDKMPDVGAYGVMLIQSF